MNAKTGSSRSFSPAFEHLCSFVLLHCTIILPDERFQSANQFMKCLDTLFGLQMPVDRLETAIDQLVKEKKLYRPGGTFLAVDPALHLVLRNRIEEASALQDRVKTKWLDDSANTGVKVDRQQAWAALQRYLSGAFRRHGMQTVALLGAFQKVAPDYFDSLQSILRDALSETCDADQRPDIEASIKDFLARVASDPDRSKYIVQLADGAFSYYSLTVPPDVASHLTEKLNELTLFLDTNFLFGILHLHGNPLVEVCNELLKVIEGNRLPFKLRYHEVTQKEFRRTIQAITRSLKERQWPQSISRAAARSRNVSGIEQRFHAQNALTPIDAEIFFKPFDHVDMLLKDKGILIYRTTEDRTVHQTDLVKKYKSFLDRRGKEKPTESIIHDVSLLDCVHHLRSTAPSSLEAKALCITCDYLFTSFDWEEARANNGLTNTILPNQFMQLLRPFVPASEDFDRSFAETFAIPEFRTIDSRSSIAASKMLALLAAYGSVREETASSMLANDILLDKLRHAKDDKDFREHVESAIVAENSLLIEERTALAEQLSLEKSQRAAAECERHLELERLRAERDALAEGKSEAEKIGQESEEQLQVERSQYAEARETADEQRAALEAAQSQLSAGGIKLKSLERTNEIFRITIGLIVGFLFAGAVEILVHYFKWGWLLSHPNGYSIRVGLGIAEILFFFGLFVSTWRKWCWGTGVIGVIFVLLALLGGPGREK